jgi:hypothetical protein
MYINNYIEELAAASGAAAAASGALASGAAVASAAGALASASGAAVASATGGSGEIVSSKPDETGYLDSCFPSTSLTIGELSSGSNEMVSSTFSCNLLI